MTNSYIEGEACLCVSMGQGQRDEHNRECSVNRGVSYNQGHDYKAGRVVVSWLCLPHDN